MTRASIRQARPPRHVEKVRSNGKLLLHLDDLAVDALQVEAESTAIAVTNATIRYSAAGWSEFQIPMAAFQEPSACFFQMSTNLPLSLTGFPSASFKLYS